MRVLIEARVDQATVGGVETVLLGLADGLSSLDVSDTFQFLVRAESHEWLTSRLHGPCTWTATQDPPSLTGHRSSIGRHLDRCLSPDWADRARAARWRARDLAAQLLHSVPLPPADVDLDGVDVVHFPYQFGYRTTVPSVFQPHDLQHLHLPQYFSHSEHARRTAVYRALCAQARAVVVNSRWTATDLVRSLGVPQDRIKVVNLAPLTRSTAQKSQKDLPEHFAYFPAATWPHKNHVTLLHALADLRDAGLVVPLVCSGQLTDHYEALRELVTTLGLRDQVRFLGFVSDEEVGLLYQRARLIVMPTRFEAASFPVWEGFAVGVPVVCSNVTSLPEQVGDAGLLVDPLDRAGWVHAIRLAWSDDARRDDMVSRGKQQLARLSWYETARRMHAVYRLANATATASDWELLSLPPAI